MLLVQYLRTARKRTVTASANWAANRHHTSNRYFIFKAAKLKFCSAAPFQIINKYLK